MSIELKLINISRIQLKESFNKKGNISKNKNMLGIY
jgi:hypothetical protein